MRARIAGTTTALVLLALTSGCGSGDPGASTSPPRQTAPPPLPVGGEVVDLDPAAFTTRIDNPYWPMPPGRRWVFRETDAEGAEQRVTVTVTDRTTVVMGITARVVRDVVSEDGVPVEVTDDWYAQDRRGNVWYLGEATREFENGRPTSTEGSWRAGVGGAQPGIAMPADPAVGLAYRQEYLKGEAEDAAEVLRTGQTVTTPAGTFNQVIVTRDTTPLEPDLVEHKYYARGVGPVQAVTVSGGSGREVLVERGGP